MSSRNKASKRFTSDENSVFCNQIAMMLNSGIPIHEGTYILYNEMEDKNTKEVLRTIDEVMKDNGTLHQALDDSKAFPDYMIHMVRVGEDTGRLEEVMRSLSAYYERDSKIKAGIKSAVAYPMVLFAMMTAVMIALVWKILPLFEEMFQELNAEVAASTKEVMGFGLNFGKIVAIVTCVILGIAVFILLLYKTDGGEKRMKAFLAKSRLTAKMSELLATGKFISSMSLMIGSGMDIQGALDSEAASSENSFVKDKITQCADDFREGKHLDEALRDHKLIDGMEGRMLSVAQKTGAMDTLFDKLSNQYNDRISSSLSRLSTVIETLLVVILSVLVGAVLLSVMLPLVSMISSIG